MNKNISTTQRSHSFLSITSLDAVFISLSWYCYLSIEAGAPLIIAHLFILGSSIWLGYMSDRLLDIRSLADKNIRTRRHQFAKANARLLWYLWLGLLAVDLYVAFSYLEPLKRTIGLRLTLLTLIYTVCNQWLFRKYFPKELFVSLLFAYAVLFFINADIFQKDLYLFASVCFLNCLALSQKERSVDAIAGKRSLGSLIDDTSFRISLIALSGVFICFKGGWNIYLAISLSLLALSLNRDRISIESYRMLIESLYILYPILFILF